MELRQLKHFVALAEERSFTRAAARELIVQSGLSSSIRGLEQDVGAALVRRGSRPVTLTAEGEALLPEARRALRAAEDGRKAVRDVASVISGRLSVGMAQTSGTGCPFLEWLSAFAQAHPGLDVTVEQLSDAQMLDRLAAAGLDCALTASPARADVFDVYPISTTALQAIVPAGHRLARATKVRLADLAAERFVEMQPGSGTRARTDAIFAERHLTREIACTVNEWSMLVDLVSAGMGVALVPEGLVGTAVAVVPLADVTIEQRWTLVLPAPGEQTPAARRFAQFVLGRQTTYRTSARRPTA
ncbi:LysR family transcriptional regulator [Paractinoplanes lichenicola]|uniref:LysR family transcriptional regulator n=1 Tax=Paractinoplanes lichenicola TaxID=2802976 RepID=A0ABS1VMN9_9ACTN|nr:LysR family transcriptional regulator [Actinoplanes lichenicola]MBL7255920.1 LysR family transcriptional regulator [Actinoplanes lichenicola]